MTLNIPDSVGARPSYSRGRDCAAAPDGTGRGFVRTGRALSLGKAAEFAEMNRMLFGDLVGQRGIPRHYGEAELAQDTSYAGGRAGRLDQNAL